MKNYTYKIKKGNHSSGLRFVPKISKNLSLSGRFKFADDCLYNLGNENNYDMNKLIGISLGYHMKNSIRIGWRCKENKIELYSYIHKDGKIITDDINTNLINGTNTFLYLAKPNEIIKFNIKKVNAKYKYCEINLYTEDNKLIISNHVPFWDNVPFWDFSYLLYPYFGGNEAAPHDMDIPLEYEFL